LADVANENPGTETLYFFKIDFAKYSQEIGGFSGALEDKRTSFQLSLIF